MQQKKTSIYSVDFKDEREIAGFVSALFDTKSTFKQNLERQWYLNIAWYIGLQNYIWNSSTKGLFEPDAPSYRVRMVVNMLQSTIRKLSAKIYKAQPTWDVIPSTSDSEDINRAAMSKNILDFEWIRNEMPSLGLETLLWMMTTGNGFNKAFWDPEAGDPIPVPLEDGTLDFAELATGETKVELVTPFDMNFDINGSFYDSAWALETKLMDASQVEDKYEMKIKGSPHVSINRRTTRFKEYLKHLTVNRADASLGGSSTDEEQTAVHELWIRPGMMKKLPKGGYYVIVGDKVMNGKGKGVDFPFMHGRLPYVHFREVAVPGRAWGECTLTQLLPLQASYNKTRSQLQEAKNLMSKPKWIVPKGSGLSATSITSEPGEVLEPNPGFTISQVAPVPLPSYVANLLTQDKSDMEDISSIHEVSKADSPGQLRGSQGVMALIEQDETTIALTIQDHEHQLAKLGRQILSLNAQFVTEERLARIIGENNEALIFSFKGRDLVGISDMPGANYFDVRVETVVGLPSSKQAQQSMLINLTDKGFLNPQDPKDKKFVFRMLSLGNTMDHLDKSRPQRGQQLKEIETMLEGRPVKPEPWQDHDVHLEVLNDFRNGPRFEQLDNQTKQILEQHSQMHKQMIAFNAVEPQLLVQQMVGQLTQGGPPNGQGQKQQVAG